MQTSDSNNKTVNSARLDELVKQENVSKRIDSAVEKIRASFTNEAAAAYLQNKIASIDGNDDQKKDVREKIDGFLKMLTSGLNADSFKTQIAATLGEEKLKTITDVELLTEIEKIENDLTSKTNEYIDKYVDMIHGISKQKQEQASAVEAEKPAEKEKAANGTSSEADKQKALAAEYLGMLQRMKADFDNYKKRVIKEREEYRTLALESFFTDFLPVLDSFDAIKPESKIDYEGVQKIYKLINTIIEKHSLKEIDTNIPFDANFHQALNTEAKDDVEENTILETFRKGYKLGERIIRPSLVKVSVKQEQASGTEPGGVESAG